MKYFFLDLKDLNLLQAIKIRGNLKIAAESLHLSQATLSLQIKKLEYRVDAKILDRQKRQIVFTIFGELLLNYANKLLKIYQEADRAILYLKNIKRTTLLIGSNEFIGTNLLPKMITMFCKKNPFYQVGLKLDNNNSTCWDVVNGRIDLGILEYDDIPKQLNKILHITPYFDEEIILTVPFFKTLNNSNNKTMNQICFYLDLLSLKYLQNGKEFMYLTLKNSRTQGYDIKLEVISLESLKTRRKTNLQILYIPSLLLYINKLSTKLLDQNSKIRDKAVILKRKIVLISHKQNLQFHSHNKFYDFCLKISKKTFLNLDY